MIIIPILLSVLFLWLMFRPLKSKPGDIGAMIDQMARILWLIPVAITWVIYGLLKIIF